MKTIGHHTCKPDGRDEVVLEKAPFFSTKDKYGNYPFLGEGFYFWDNNLELAHYWGLHHYNNSYKILQSELNLESSYFFDIVGNRSHMILLSDLHKKFSEKYNRGKKYTIGKFLEVLKDLNKNDYKGIFPYKVCRSIDLSRSNHFKQHQYNFVYKKDNYTNLAPRIVICLYEVNDVILQSKILINQN